MRKIWLIIFLFPLFAEAQKSMQHYYELNSLIHNYNYFDEAVTTSKLRKKLQIKSIKKERKIILPN